MVGSGVSRLSPALSAGICRLSVSLAMKWQSPCPPHRVGVMMERGGGGMCFALCKVLNKCRCAERMMEAAEADVLPPANAPFGILILSWLLPA